MPTSIDDLYIEIDANAVKANDAIDRLVGKLDRLSVSLGKVNGSGLTGLANGVQKLGTSMQSINNVKTADFTRLSNNLTKLAALSSANLQSSASAVTMLSKALKSLTAVSASAQSIGDTAKNIAKLGNKSVQQAVVNIPQLATALNNLMVTLARSPQVNQNLIDMTNALANLASQSRIVGTASSSIVTGLSRTDKSLKRTRKSTLSLAAAFGRFYASYFLVIRGLKGLWNSIESTADYIEAFNYYNVAFGKIASEWDQDWGKYGYENAETYAESFTKRMEDTFSKLSGIEVGAGILSETGLKNLGLNIQEVTQYASQLASVTNSIGQTGEATVAISTAFTKLAGDISSLFNVDFQTVSKNLQSGLNGQSRALYKYGIDITNATLQTKAYELGLEKSVAKMAQMEKQQLRVLSILQQSKVSWGDLANTINSPSNMIRQLTNNLKEAGIVLGQLFIPVLEKALPVINGFAIAIKRLLVNIAQILGIKINFDAFGQGYSDLEDDVDGITESMDELEESAKKAQASLRGFDELKVINLSAGTTNANGLQETIDLTEEIIQATEEYEVVWNQAFSEMENKAQEFADSISGIFSPIENLFSAFAEDDFTKAGEELSNLTKGIFNFFNKAIEDVDWENVGSNAVELFIGIDWLGVFEGLIDLATTLDEAIENFFKGVVQEVIDTFNKEEGKSENEENKGKGIEIFNKWLNWFVSSWFTKPVAAPIVGIVSFVHSIAAGIVTYMNTGDVGASVKRAIEILIGWFSTYFRLDWPEVKRAFSIWWDNQVAPWFTKEQWSKLGNGIKEGLMNSFNTALNEVKKLWNDLAEWFNKISWFDLPTFEIDVTGGGGKRRGIEGFSTGGYPIPGDLFYANERGPELIGTINGKTAVASNGEITGISDAIYNTGQTEASLLQTAVGLLQVIAEKEYGITDNQIGESARRYASDYHRRTGDYAFI